MSALYFIEDVYDYTDILECVVKPPVRRVKAGLIHLIVPRGMHVNHLKDGGVCIDLKRVKEYFGTIDYVSHVCRTTEALLAQYKIALESLNKSEKYRLTDHSKFTHTLHPRVSLSRQAYEELGIRYVRGIVIIKNDGYYLINYSIARKEVTKRAVLINSPGVREVMIRKIHIAILSKGEAWVKANKYAQEFLSEHVGV